MEERWKSECSIMSEMEDEWKSDSLVTQEMKDEWKSDCFSDHIHYRKTASKGNGSKYNALVDEGNK
jgi:hypothetical protein